jgi:hypothetical protein
MEQNETIKEKPSHRPEEEINDPVGELAWEYCQKSRNGENPSMAACLQRLEPKDRREFKRLVTLDTLIDAAADFQSRIAIVKSE